MKPYYVYSSETGEILRTGFCDNVMAQAVSEFEVAAEGKASDLHDYIKDGQVTPKGAQPTPAHIFNYATGQWDLDLSLAKSQKWAEIKAARDAQEFSTFDWGGYTFQCDEVSQRRIQGAVQLAQLDPSLTMDWTLADNSVQTFTAADFVNIGTTLAAHVSSGHTRSRLLRADIEAATTQQELEAIVW